MASIRKFGAITTLATKDDLDGTVDNSQVLDITGSAFGAIIGVINIGTAGTAGIDVVEFSRDGGTTWKAATAANIGKGHKGLLKFSDNTAVASAALEAAGVEPTTAALTLFYLPPVDGQCKIRIGRLTTTTSGTTWVTGAPEVFAVRIG